MINIDAIPAFSDNYIWCLYCTETNKALVVDPGSFTEVLSFLDSHNLTLDAILITHHHPDHTGGVKKLVEATHAKVIGSLSSKLNIFDQRVQEGETLTLLGQTFTCIDVPGHTLDHIAFFTEASNHLTAPALFCGDTLFSGGCGRLFEGSAEQMHASLKKLARLPDNTLVYCAHEYTLANLAFAHSLMPNNEELNVYTELCKERRANLQSTIPSTLATELKINPFLLSRDTELIDAIKRLYPDCANDELSIFTATRKAKDNF